MLRTCDYVILPSNRAFEDVIQVNNLQVGKGPGLSTMAQANHESLKADNLSLLWPQGDVTTEGAARTQTLPVLKVKEGNPEPRYMGGLQKVENRKKQDS